jgi:hypothetical protein
MMAIDGDSGPSYVFRSAEDSDDETNPPIDIEDIDLQALAEEVYALLKQELWLERERRGWHQIW